MRHLFSLLAAFLLTPCADLHAAVLAVENHKSGELLDYQVVLLRGTVEDGAKTINISHVGAAKKSEITQGVVRDGRFKALVMLRAGTNQLAIQSDRSKAPIVLTLDFAEAKNPHYVRLVWMTDSTGATDFATPTNDVPQDYEARVRTAALLMQTFTAESMNDSGYGRRTFRLERDAKGEVVVHTLKAPKPAASYAELKDTVWWSDVYQWLNREHRDDYAKNMVLASFTRKDPVTNKMTNHTALGGGNLGLFGSASIFSWPRSIAAAQAVFSDSTVIDQTKVHDDSAGRSVVWGLASTTMGATLHEMGHTFGLPHTKDGRDIMTRGFDRFHRSFVFEDAPSKSKPKPVSFQPDQEAYWAPISASSLRWSRWFAGNESQNTSKNGPQITVDAAGGTVTVTSPLGVVWIGFGSQGENVTFQEFSPTNPPLKVTLTLDELRAKMGKFPLTQISALGTNGESSKKDF